MSEHAQVQQLLPLYVLGALDETEDCELVCAHLATGCVACAQELSEHARTAAHLADALPPVAPRPEARLALEKRLAAAEPAAVTSLATRRVLGRPSWPWVVVPAAVAAAALIAAFNLNEQLRWERNRHWDDAKEIADLSAEKDHLAREIAKNDALTGALATGEARVIELAPASAGQTGAGHLIWNKKDRTWTLLASGMKPLSPDQVYELWFIRNGADPRSAIRFQPGPDGIVRQTVAVPADLPAIDLAAVTLEPRKNDDPKPSGTMVIAGKFTG